MLQQIAGAGVAEAVDVPVPAETYCNSDDLAATVPSGVFPALIKPNFGNASIGISQDAVVNTWEEAIAYLSRLRQLCRLSPILIQEFLTGPEYSVGLIGNPGAEAAASCRCWKSTIPVLIPALPRVLTYESKWIPGFAVLDRRSPIARRRSTRTPAAN